MSLKTINFILCANEFKKSTGFLMDKFIIINIAKHVYSILRMIELYLMNNTYFLLMKHTHELCLEIVKKNGLALEFIKNKSHDICLEAVKQNGLAIQFIKKQKNTSKKYHIHLNKEDYYKLKHIIEKENLSMITLNNSNCTICYNHVMCAFYDDIFNSKLSKKSINLYKFSKDLFSEAVRQNGMAIKYIKNCSYDLYLAAVRQNGHALKYVQNIGEGLIDFNKKPYFICFESVKQNGLAIQYVDTGMKTYELCLQAVKQNGLALQYIDEELQTYFLCMKAIKQNGLAIQYVANKTKNICAVATKYNINAYQYIYM